MKKILLGTSALVGAALLSNVALAQTPKVTVGGFSEFQAGFRSDDFDASERDAAFRNDNEISFKVDGKTDGGLGYGAEIWLEADVTGDADNQGLNASKTFLYVEGMWGRFEAGSNLGVDQTLKIDAASIARATGGIDGDFYYYINTGSTAGVGNGVPADSASFGSAAGVRYIATPDLPLNYGQGALGDESRENLTKITYYTPKWNGFQAGVSYLIDERNRGQGSAAVGANGALDLSDNNAGESENIFVGALNYSTTWNQWNFGIAATGEWGSAQNSLYEDLSAWNVGAKVAYMGFSVAGSYGDIGESNRLSSLNADESWYWTLGGAYEYGPFGVSVTYLDSQYSVTSTTENDFTSWSVGADYKLAPGLTPYVEYTHFDQEAVGTANDNEGHVFLVGSSLNF